jgi:hypothetical protein
MPTPARFLLALGLILFALPALAQAPAPAQPPAPRLADLAWIAGRWEGEMPGGSKIEEIWSAPAAGAMMGMWRWTEGDKVRLYEFFTFETGADGVPVLQLRHFRAGLIALEDKETPMTFRLVAWKDGEHTFEHQDPARPTRLVYRRGGDDSMTVLLLRTQDGATRSDEFKYTRRK